MKKTLVLAVVMVAGVAATAGRVWAQDASIDNDIAVLRADLKADKTKIMTDQMQLTDQEASAFWPIYRQYQSDLDKLSDQKVALIKEYADKYDTMDDKEVQSLAERSFALQKKRIDLRQQYFKKISKAVSAKSAARFVQVEDRIDMLVNLQLAASIPMVKK
jgi:hypothetical protein